MKHQTLLDVLAAELGILSELGVPKDVLDRFVQLRDDRVKAAFGVGHSDVGDPEEVIIQSALAQLAAVAGDQLNGQTAVASGYVLLVEFTTLDGQAWMMKFTADNDPIWKTKGLLFEALHGRPD